MSFLQVQALCKWYGATQVLKEVSFSLSKGQCLVVSGPNGAGKSTLLHCLAGLLAVDGGSVQIEGQNCTTQSDLATVIRTLGVGVLPQKNLLYPSLSVVENLRLHALITEQSSVDLEELIAALGLDRFLETLLEHCSQGIARRVGLARAVLAGRALLVLDEPFANVDPAGLVEITRVLEKKRKEGCTMIIASHQSDLAALTYHSRLTLQDGKACLCPLSSVVSEERTTNSGL